MSDTFAASNGEKVTRYENGDLAAGSPPLMLTPVGVVTLREFFQHERDKELGRWRFDRGSRGYVVYPKVNGSVRVLEEITGQSEVVTRESAQDDPDSWPSEVADAYFAAHPEPKPWHDAKPGEVWVLNFDGNEVPAIAVADEGSPSFQFGDSAGDPSRVGTEHPGVVDARRIWPEVTP